MIRCHNYGRFLREAVESVHRQTRPADEIVVVDDGSTDDTSAVLADLTQRSTNLIVLSRHPARGPARSFNDGVARSAGDLVVALDADDRLSSNYLQLLEDALADSSVDFAYAGEMFFGSERCFRPPVPFDPAELMRENYVNVSAMFRRWVFDVTRGFRPELDALGLEDWEFWVHAVEHGAVGRAVEGCWLEYRRHPGGSRNTLTRFRVLRAHLVIWRLHWRVVHPWHVAGWAVRSVRRNSRRIVARMADNRRHVIEEQRDRPT